jgi:hypothetical protein
MFPRHGFPNFHFRAHTAGIVGIAAFVLTSTAQAFPVLFKATETPLLVGVPTSNIVALTPVNNGKTWNRIPIQFDEIEDNAFLILRRPDKIFPIREKVNHPPATDPFHGSVSQYHRIVLNDAHFASCDESCVAQANIGIKKICESNNFTPIVYKVTATRRGTSAFVSFCNSELKPLPKPDIQFADKSLEVKTPQYSAQLSNASPFLINWINIGNQSPVIQNTDLRAKLKTRMLFKLNIDSSDLGGKLASVTNNPLATSLEIATIGKVMGIKLVEQVCCDISFFDDAFYFPVLISIPGAIGKLRDGSEVSYAFQSLSQAPLTPTEGSSPVLTFEQDKKFIAVAFRPTNKSNAYKSQILNAKELQEREFKRQNSGISIGLGGAESEQRFEAWFYIGDNLELLKDYATHGVRNTVQRVFPSTK